MYWDTNGAAAGSSAGTTASGTWDASTTANWSTDSTGSSSTVTWNGTAGNKIASFSAGTNATGASTITVSGTPTSIAGFRFDDGTITITGGTGLTLAANSTATVAAGASASIATPMSGAFSFTKDGAGSLTLNGSAVNSYTGATGVNAGTLVLNFANLGTPTNLVSSSSVLALGGGTLQVVGQSTGTTSQTFASTTLNSGASSIVRTPNGGTATNVTVGAITRNLGGTVDFSAPASGNIITTGGTKALLGGWATVGGTDFAAVNASNQIIAASYVTNTWASGNNTNVTSSNSPTTGSTTGSLRFNTAGAQTVTLSGTNTITSGGILVTSNVGNNTTTITGGTLRGAASGDLVIHENNASGNLTIASTIADNTLTGLTKGGVGTLILSGTNTYTGATTINGGVLQITSIANGGTNSNIGASGNSASNLVLNGGTLKYASTTAAGSTNRLFTLGSNGGTIDASGSGANTLSFTTAAGITNSGTGNRTLTLAGSNTGTNTLAPNIGNPTGGVTNLTKTGAGQWVVSGNNTYTGVTTVSGGTLTFTTLGNGGVSGNLGQASAAASNLVLDGGTLKFTGTSAQSTNRLFTLGASGATLDASGTSTLTFTGTGALGLSGSGSRTLTLTGTNTGTNSLAASIADPTGGTTSISKTSTGTWALSGNNSFTGNVTVSGGVLGAGTNATALGTGAATLTLNGGSLALANDTGLDFGRNTTVSSNATIYSTRATNGAAVTHSLGTLSIGAQTLSLATTGTTTSGTAGLTFDATTLTGAAVFDTAASTQLTLGSLSGNFGFTKQNSGTLTLNQSSTRSSGVATVSGGTLNLADSAALGTTGATISLGTGSTLQLSSASSVNAYNTTVTGNATIASDRATVGDGITHTLGTLSIGANTLTVTKGTNAASGTAGVTFGATTLTGAASFAPASGTQLTLGTVTGTNTNLSDTGAGNMVINGAITTGSGTVTMSGAGGTLTLAGANTYTGATNVTAGTLKLGTSGSGSNSALGTNASGTTVSSGAALDLNGFNVTTTEALTLSGTGLNNAGALTNSATGTTSSYAGALTLGAASSIGGVGNITLNGAIGDGASTFGFTKVGTGTLTLNGAATNGSAAVGTTLLGGSLVVHSTTGSLTASSPVTFSGTSTLRYENSSAAGASNVSLGALTTTTGAGEATVFLDHQAAQTQTLTFGSFTRAAGSTVLFQLTSGTAASTTYKIGLTGQTTNAFLGAGAFFNSGSGATTYAFYDTNGFVRAANYGTDANSLTFTGAMSGTSTTTRARITGSTTFSQAAASLNTLEITGAPTITLTGAMTLSGGGILKTGGTTATINGSTITPGNGVELSLRPDAASDTLIIGSQLVANGTNALTKSGDGTLTLNATNNTITGVTTITGGTLEIKSIANGGNSSSLGSAAATNTNLVLNGGALRYTGTNAGTSNRLFSLGLDGGTLDTGSGSGGSLTLNGTGAMGFNNQSGNRTLTLTGTNAGSLATLIGDSGGATSLVKTGSGTWTLGNASNSFTGGVTINGGTLAVGTIGNGGVAGALGAASNIASNLVLNGGTLQYTANTASTNRLFSIGTSGGTLDAGSGGGTLTFNNTGAIGFNNQSGTRTLTLTGTSSGALAPIIGDNGGATSLTKTGAGTWTLNGNNTYTGLTTVSAGTLTVASGASIGASTSTLTVSGGTLNLNNTAQTVTALNGAGGQINLGSGHTLTVNDTGSDSYSGTLAGSGALVKTGSGTLALGGNNLFTGGLTLSGGTLDIQSNTALGGAASVFTINGGTSLNTSNGAHTLTNNNAQIWNGSFSLISSNDLNLGTGNVTLNATSTITTTNPATLTVGGVIDDGGAGNGITKAGTGTLALNGANTYSGATTINGGVLSVRTLANGGSASGLGDSSNAAANLVIDNATLQFNGTSGGSTDRQFTVGVNGATLDGSATGTGAMNFANSAAITLSGTNTARALNLTGSGAGTNASTLAAAIGDNGTGATTLNKTGAGTWILSGANTYTGATNVTGGTLQLSGSGTLGGGASALTINGATLDLNSTSQTVGNFTGSSSGTVLNNGTGTSTLTFGGGNATGGNFQGTVVDHTSGSGITALAKTGSGTIILSGANTYTGGTTVGGGTLQLSGSGTLGGSSSALTVNSGILDLNSTSQTVGNLTGSGGTILNNGTGTSTLTIGGGNGTGGNFQGTIADHSSGSGVVALTKTGTGTITLGGSGTNTYTGTTTVNGGTLILQKAGAAGSTSYVIGDGTGTDTLQLGAANQLPSSSTITFTSGGTPVLNANGFSQNVATINSSNTSAQIQLGSPASATTFGVGSGTFAGGFTGGSLATLEKQGAGTLTLSGSSTNSGAVLVSSGILNLQSNGAIGSGGGTTIVSGATLQLQGGLTAAGNGLLTLNGTGAGSGALVNVSGSNLWAGSSQLASNTTVYGGASGSDMLTLGAASVPYDRGTDPLGPPTDATTLDLSNKTLTVTGNGTTQINSRLTGTGNLDINVGNSAVVRLSSNYNTYTGLTTVKNGTLEVRTTFNTYPGDPSYPNYFGINGGLVIGDGVGSANTAIVNLGSGTLNAEVLKFDPNNPSANPITINSDGKLFVQSSQTIGLLTFNGGTVDTSTAGTLFLGNKVTVNAGPEAFITGSGGSLSLTANGAFPLVEREFAVAGGAGNTSDLTISATITQGSILKTGAGTMTITGDNSFGYEGTTTINNGILNIQNGKALGTGGSTSNQTIVNSGGTLQLQGGITVSTERLVLNGDGFTTNGGALQNKSGTNTWNGTISLGSNARITSAAAADTLNIGGTIVAPASTGYLLTFDGAGTTNVTSAINTVNGGIEMAGTGTLVLSGNSGYKGTTTVDNGGTIRVRSNNGLGALDSGTVVNSGGELQLSKISSDLTIGGEALTLNGSGLSNGGTGALHNVSGNNTYQGAVQLGSGGSTIKADSGSSLTLSGGITSPTHSGLTVGGAGTVTASGAVALGTVSTAVVGGHTVITGTGSTGTLTKVDAGTFVFGGGVTHQLDSVTLTLGGIQVSGTNTLVQTGALTAAASTTLTIDSNNTVQAFYGSGNTVFSGAMAGGGTFEKDGAGTLTFNNSFAATNLTLTLNGGTLALASAAQVEFGTIHFTGNTVLDFGLSTSTLLKSATLIIDQGVTVTVNNWVSYQDQWIVTTSFYQPNAPNINAGHDVNGQAPENQIVFNGFTGSWTTWVTPQGSFGYINNEIRPTPEPATYGAIFLSTSLGFLGLRHWLRRKQAAKS